jgi:uncharacterized membrane-anchored protein
MSVKGGWPRNPATADAARSREPPDQVPVLGRFFPVPVAAKVPEIIAMFWVVKILTTAGGEVTSDYLKTYGNFGGGGTEVAMFVVGLGLQFGTRRYQAFAYWFLAYAIATAGTGISDFLHLDVHIPYLGTTILWAVILAVVFRAWHRSEGTLSIHSITTQRREAFYWATVFATFALGTALGDFTATSLSMGYLPSGLFFLAVFLLPAVAWRWLGLNSVAAFWMAYIVTRPLGASFSDWISKPSNLTGINFGNGQTALVFGVATVLLVTYLAIRRPDIQQSSEHGASHPTD